MYRGSALGPTGGPTYRSFTIPIDALRSLANLEDPEPLSAYITSPASWNRYSYVVGNLLNDLDPTGAIVSFASVAAKRAYDDYMADLDPDSEDYHNAKQLELSDVTYVVK
jgi:hypothetical protein